MKNKRILAKWYVLGALFFGVLGLIDTLITYYSTPTLLYLNFISFLFLLFFLANIFFLFYFIHNRLKSIFFILPIYHILLYIILSIIGIVVVFKEITTPSVALGFSVTAGITSIFEIIFSLYLLGKFLLFSQENIGQ
jgi:hypothetical protein